MTIPLACQRYQGVPVRSVQTRHYSPDGLPIPYNLSKLILRYGKRGIITERLENDIAHDLLNENIIEYFDIRLKRDEAGNIITFKYKNVVFRDLNRIFTMGGYEVAKKFGNARLKLKSNEIMDHKEISREHLIGNQSKYGKFYPNLMSSIHDDTNSILEVIRRVHTKTARDYHTCITKTLSTSNLAMSIFKCNFMKGHIDRLTLRIHNVIKPTYYGDLQVYLGDCHRLNMSMNHYILST